MTEFSNGPDVDLFRHDAMVGVIVIRRDDMQILHVAFDELVQFSLTEYVVVAMQSDGAGIASAAHPTSVAGQGILRR